MANDTSLDGLRGEIDRIDDQIHDLLMRRTDVVGRIGAIKRQTEPNLSALRPGREAEIVRRLIARHAGPFPVPVLVRIWRELLSAQVAVQGAFSLGVFAPEGLGVYRDLARGQFGASTPMRRFNNINQVVQEVWNGNVSIGILPFPVGERTDPWWRSLVAQGPEVPRIIARLPFVERAREDGEGEGEEHTAALAIALIAPEPTGDDVTLLAIERVSDISRDKMREDLAAVGLATQWLAVWQDASMPGHAMHLVSVDDFLPPDEPRIQDFRRRVGDAVGSAVVLGAYPRPIVWRAAPEKPAEAASAATTAR